MLNLFYDDAGRNVSHTIEILEDANKITFCMSVLHLLISIFHDWIHAVLTSVVMQLVNAILKFSLNDAKILDTVLKPVFDKGVRIFF